MPEFKHHVNAVTVTCLFAMLLLYFPSIATPMKLISQLILVTALAWIIYGKRTHAIRAEIKGYKLMIAAYLQNIALVSAVMIKSSLASMPASPPVPTEIWTSL